MRKYNAGLIACVLILGGCAVLTVDVDVYKGPLANHLDVQVHQLAAIAIGAKPILGQLRFRLEAEAGGAELFLDCLRASDHYLPEKEWRLYAPAWCSSSARQVNLILSLYDDTSGSRYAPFVRRAQDALNRYKDAWTGFRSDVTIPLPEKRNDNNDALIQGYREFMEGDDGFRSYWSLLKASSKLSDVSSLAVFTGSRQHQNKQTKQITKHADWSANAVFDAMSNSSLPAEHAKLLFPNEAARQKQFINSIRQISRDFLAAREALHDLLIASLEATAQGDSEWHDLSVLEAITDLIALLLEPTHAAAALTVGSESETIARLISLMRSDESVSRGLPSFRPHENIQRSQKSVFSKPQQEQLVRELKRQLMLNPVIAAKALLQADLIFRESSELTTLRGVREAGLTDWFSSKQKRRFGLTRGPIAAGGSEKPMPVPTWDETDRDLFLRDAALKKTLPTGLGGGRLPEGLETLIKNFLEHSSQGCGKASQVALNNLIYAYVRFAAKLLAIADNQILFSEESVGLERFVMVLQSIGNSILVQADELKHRFPDPEKSKRALEREKRALGIVGLDWPTFASDVLDGNDQHLLSKSTALEAALNGVRVKKEAVKTRKILVSNAEAKIREQASTLAKLSAAHAWEKQKLDNLDQAGKLLAEDTEDLGALNWVCAFKAVMTSLVTTAGNIKPAEFLQAMHDAAEEQRELTTKNNAGASQTLRLERLEAALTVFAAPAIQGFPSAAKKREAAYMDVRDALNAAIKSAKTAEDSAEDSVKARGVALKTATKKVRDADKNRQLLVDTETLLDERTITPKIDESETKPKPVEFATIVDRLMEGSNVTSERLLDQLRKKVVEQKSVTPSRHPRAALLATAEKVLVKASFEDLPASETRAREAWEALENSLAKATKKAVEAVEAAKREESTAKESLADASAALRSATTHRESVERARTLLDEASTSITPELKAPVRPFKEIVADLLDGAPIEPADLSDELARIASEQRIETAKQKSDHLRLRRLDAAIDVFRPSRLPGLATSAVTRDEARAAVVTQLAAATSRQKRAVDRASTLVRDGEAERNKREAAKAGAMADVKKASADLSSAEEAAKELSDEVSRRTRAVPELRSSRDAVAMSLIGGEATTATVFREKWLKALDELGSNEAKDAMWVIEGTPRPLNVPVPDESAAIEAKEVLDQVIAVLRQQLLEAKKSGNEERVHRLEKTIYAAYMQRSGMIYLRPAAAFLRNSYPVAALQGDPGLSWTNRLGRQFWRNLPGYETVRGLANPNEHRRAETIEEIDKRYWQNINRVRVVGAGNTNYVIAKDDVGNWYVKQYAADPEPIIQSARSLALAAAPGLNSEALQKLGKEASEGVATVDSRSELGKLFDKYEAEYVTRTDRTFETLLKEITDRALAQKLKSDEAMKAGFTGDVTNAKLDTAVDKAWKDLVFPAEAEMTGSRSADRSLQIIDTLQRVRRFYERVRAEIPESDKREAATKSLQAIVAAFLERFHGERKKATGDFEKAVLFISEATGSG